MPWPAQTLVCPGGKVQKPKLQELDFNKEPSQNNTPNVQRHHNRHSSADPINNLALRAQTPIPACPPWPQTAAALAAAGLALRATISTNRTRKIIHHCTSPIQRPLSRLISVSYKSQVNCAIVHDNTVLDHSIKHPPLLFLV